MPVINEDHYPILYKFRKLREEQRTTIKDLLVGEKTFSSENSEPLLRAEIEVLTQDRWFGCACFGDPMGDPPLACVLIQGQTYEEASQKLKDDPRWGLSAPVDWGCGGFCAHKKDTYDWVYLFKFKTPETLYNMFLNEDAWLEGNYYMVFWEELPRD